MKTALTQDKISNFLGDTVGLVDNIEQMVEGEESQAFSFSVNAQKYIIRINPSIKGFIKDNYSYQHFTSELVPIPKVVKLGQIDGGHAYCISEMAAGITFQDANEAQITSLLEPVTKLWRAIGETDISSSKGYGELDDEGNGTFTSWRQYLLSILDDSKYDWAKVADLVDTELVKRLGEKFRELVEACPEDRHLVHGDFGSNNLLVEGGTIEAVIDWENALYGDALYDIAGVHFWRTWLLCMEKSDDYWQQNLSHIPNFKERTRCYQLRQGLHEIYDTAIDGDAKMLGWLQDRCREILAETN